MNRREMSVWVSLVAAGVALRLGFEHLPNFAPVAAIALFSGYYFRSRIAAVTAPLAVMLVTDWQIGGYQPLMMAAVYFGLALPVFFGGPLRRRLPLEGRRGASALGSWVALLGCAASASLAFFLITNLATWWVSGIYPHTAAGLVNCYVQALPFFRFTFAGDAVFAVGFFGTYAVYCAWCRQRVAALAIQP